MESTNVLFAVQLKTSHQDKIKIKELESEKGLNQLNRYELKRLDGKKYDNIKKTTIEYWKGFEIPVYLFVVALSNDKSELYYKRYTPVLHGHVEREEQKFYKASEGKKFLAFATSGFQGGFCRDLFIDYIRCNYKKDQ